MKSSLREYRDATDETQGELAAAVDVSRQTINAIERDRYDPSLALAFDLADHFDCAVDDLFQPGSDADE